jgi:hypothetical protein
MDNKYNGEALIPVVIICAAWCFWGLIQGFRFLGHAWSPGSFPWWNLYELWEVIGFLIISVCVCLVCLVIDQCKKDRK